MNLFDNDKGTVIIKIMSAQKKQLHLHCNQLKRSISNAKRIYLIVSYSNASLNFKLI